MVSTKERIKYARIFDKQTEVLQRQRDALTRMTLMLTEASAALFEIASVENQMARIPQKKRAQAALDRMEAIRSSGNADDGEESKETTDEGDGSE